MKTDNFNLPN